MGEYVKDAILTGDFHDLVLLRLVELTIAADRTKEPLFSSLLQTPAFFRKYFAAWVREALEEKQEMERLPEGPYVDA